MALAFVLCCICDSGIGSCNDGLLGHSSVICDTGYLRVTQHEPRFSKFIAGCAR